ncbi:hypothetical protein SAMN05443247_05455 [Bradyrhizobium erythrophlei]|nr:hypothetical protein SAMN05443247_05455 [Bradyrhizobium erythrophlei]
MIPMHDQTIWQRISTAPFGCDLELAVIEEAHVHQLVFACRRAPGGWINAQTNQRVIVRPTHWRLWATND